MFGQVKLRHAVELGQQTAYLAGNATKVLLVLIQ